MDTRKNVFVAMILVGLFITGWSVPAQSAEPSFTASDIAGDTGESLGAVMGDVDNDGDLDIYVVNRNNQQNRLWINAGGYQMVRVEMRFRF